jgi:guanylate kinase
VGPGASGKSHLYEQFPPKLRSVKYTTRPMRSGEEHGVDYNFVDEYTFRTMNERGLFQFHETFNGWHYGTTVMSWNTHRVFILPPSVVEKQHYRKEFIVFLDIPRRVREERLSRRLGSADSVERRLLADLLEFATFRRWSYRVIDPDFDAEKLVYRILRL